MSFDTLRVWVESTIQDQIAVTFPAVDIRFGNASVLQPATTWMATRIRDHRAKTLSIFNRTGRHFGEVCISVLVPDRQGTSLGNQITEFLGNALRYQDITLADGARVNFSAPRYASKGAENGYYRLECCVPFRRDEPG
jgi:hypothetical protein